MKVVDVSSKKNFLKQIQDALHESLPKKEVEGVDAFVAQLLVSAYIEEFAGRRLADVLGSLLGFWKFVQTLPTDRAKVEVYNPNLEEFGWQSTHTIVAVLCHNMPFIIDSVRMVLSTRNVNVHGIQHAILHTERDGKGKLVQLKDAARKGKADDATAKESVMLIEVDRHSDQDALAALKVEIESVLTDVRTTVQDYPAMLAEAKALAQSLADGKYPGVDASEQQEGAAFLNWVADDSFTFLGHVEYRFDSKDKQQLVKVPGSALGILRHLKNGELSIDLASLSSKARKNLQSPELFTFAKAYERSRVHRPAYPDYISVKQFDKKGNVTGEKRFVGLYTARAYNETPDQIPLLRQKVQKVREKSGFDTHDYSGRALEQMLIVYPRDELFQIDVKELFHTMMSTLYIQERRKIKLFMREDAFGGFVTCIVYVPRDIFNTDLRLKIQRILMDALNGEDIDFSTYISESVLARTLFNIKVTPVEDRHVDVDERDVGFQSQAQLDCLGAVGRFADHRAGIFQQHQAQHAASQPVVVGDDNIDLPSNRVHRHRHAEPQRPRGGPANPPRQSAHQGSHDQRLRHVRQCPTGAAKRRQRFRRQTVQRPKSDRGTGPLPEEQQLAGHSSWNQKNQSGINSQICIVCKRR